MHTLTAYGIVACAFGWAVLCLFRSMRRPNRARPKPPRSGPGWLKPGCGACGRGCRQKKDAHYGEC
jgi:hypothetical protein